MLKKCNKCQQFKSFECFSTVKPGRGDRYNLASRCKECRSKKNMELHRKNYVRSLEKHREWSRNNPDKVIAYARKWRFQNKERHQENNKKWKQKNPARNSFNQTRRKAAQMRATPAWLTAIQLAQIQEFYDVSVAISMQTGIKHHVDHIHPLDGKTFNGLHVPWNLQVLPALENIAKKNRIPENQKELFWGDI